jgi:hypothetical protein
MNYLDKFRKEAELIKQFGEGNAYLIWTMSMYLDHPDPIELGSEALTDGSDDKKIDFIRLDRELNKIVFAQGYYSSKQNDSAPANKASDLNTASAWLISGDIFKIPTPLREIVVECREAIKSGEVVQIDLLYVHNLPESVTVSRELITASQHLLSALQDNNIKVVYKELGIERIEKLFAEIKSSILVTDNIECPAPIKYTEDGPAWKAHILTIPGEWLRETFNKYGDNLFSANYRGFLGVSKRKKINSGIKTTAEKVPSNFWVYNNGVTILTTNVYVEKTKVFLSGMSIINGAQTTGSIGSLELKISLADVKVPARIIECSDPFTIDEIVKFNNTQNKITTWDKFSNAPEQKRILEEFSSLGHVYSLKRGFNLGSAQIGIENVIQPLIALQGYYQEANGGKNGVFESDKMYNIAFEEKKARHILFAFALSRAIDEKRNELRVRRSSGSILDIEEKQLLLLRNLRFKYFLISIIGKCLPVILGRQISLSDVGINPEFANTKNTTLVELVAEVVPLINLVLTITSNSINKDFSELITQDSILDTLSSQVSSIIYVTKSPTVPIFATMDRMLSE